MHVARELARQQQQQQKVVHTRRYPLSARLPYIAREVIATRAPTAVQEEHAVYVCSCMLYV